MGDYSSSSGSSASNPAASTSEFSTPPDSRAATPTVRCFSCAEHVDEDKVVTLVCHHHWCQDCLARFYKFLLKDQSLFPPHCRDGGIRKDDEVRSLPGPVLIGGTLFCNKCGKKMTPPSCFCLRRHHKRVALQSATWLVDRQHDVAQISAAERQARIQREFKHHNARMQTLLDLWSEHGRRGDGVHREAHERRETRAREQARSPNVNETDDTDHDKESVHDEEGDHDEDDGHDEDGDDEDGYDEDGYDEDGDDEDGDHEDGDDEDGCDEDGDHEDGDHDEGWGLRSSHSKPGHKCEVCPHALYHYVPVRRKCRKQVCTRCVNEFNRTRSG